MRVATLSIIVLLMWVNPASGQVGSFNWESPHINPLDLSPDGKTLLAVNTADHRLEVFDVSDQGLRPRGSVPVGLDPVSVRARTSTEAWVVNHISDSISVVDLTTLSVVATIATGDEPADVVFAGSPQRAFVSVSQFNQVRVYDPANLATPPTIIEIEGEDPRALATDGETVYAGIFESGNHTTIIRWYLVSSSLNPYLGNPNPPPNLGLTFDPPLNPFNALAPEAGLIVRQGDDGVWRDDNGADWTRAVEWNRVAGWHLHGHEVATIDANTLAVDYVNDLMNLNMNLAVGPDGALVVIGTEALNEVRYEPNLSGRFLRVLGARIEPGGGSVVTDLNPHLDYTTSTVPQPERDRSLGDPRGIDISDDTGRVYVSGMGSNNLIVLDPALNRQGRVEVGQGPTGVRVDDARGRVYVLNRFDASVSVVDTSTLTETRRVAFHDSTSEVVRQGRPMLYDTHQTSGLGHVSCGSCHIDGRTDALAWDLGDPSGSMLSFFGTCSQLGCAPWHPMKGPMMTQTLLGLAGTNPQHWRGDRRDLMDFSGAFASLLGDDETPTMEDMLAFEAFVDTLTIPPNPYRNLDGSLSTALFNGGNAARGKTLFDATLNCISCHVGVPATSTLITPPDSIVPDQNMGIPQMRDLYERTGMEFARLSNNRGFGYTHDGHDDTLFNLLFDPAIPFAAGELGNQQRRDVEAYFFSFAVDTPAAMGAQVTVDLGSPEQMLERDQLVGIAASGAGGVVVHGLVNGEPRGYHFLDLDVVQSDRRSDVLAMAHLDALVAAGATLTYTLVPSGTSRRLGIDRDLDGHFDRDELDACTDPADPLVFPGQDPCPADVSGGATELGDGNVGIGDFLRVLSQWGRADPEVDIDCSGEVDIADFLAVLTTWGPCL